MWHPAATQALYHNTTHYSGWSSLCDKSCAPQQYIPYNPRDHVLTNTYSATASASGTSCEKTAANKHNLKQPSLAPFGPGISTHRNKQRKAAASTSSLRRCFCREHRDRLPWLSSSWELSCCVWAWVWCIYLPSWWARWGVYPSTFLLTGGWGSPRQDPACGGTGTATRQITMTMDSTAEAFRWVPP